MCVCVREMERERGREGESVFYSKRVGHTQRADVYPGFTVPSLSVIVTDCFAMLPVLLESSVANVHIVCKESLTQRTCKS